MGSVHAFSSRGDLLLRLICLEDIRDIRNLKRVIQKIREYYFQADGSIRIYVPEFKAGTIAEVIILESSEQVEKRSMVVLIGKGRGSFFNI
jgi:hypothetical protein